MKKHSKWFVPRGRPMFNTGLAAIAGVGLMVAFFLANPPNPDARRQSIAWHEAASPWTSTNQVETTAGTVVLTNPSHKVTFSSDGVLLKPAAGGPAWHWRLSTIEIGSAPLLDNGADAEPVAESNRKIAYDRGQVSEHYLAKTHSIEQQFIIHEPLPHSGDNLVITGEVQSDGEFVQRSESWVWRNQGGQVTLGDVTVYDAGGEQLLASMSVGPTSTRIEVDGEALAGALYPVTIDPEIGANDFLVSTLNFDPESGNHLQSRDSHVAYNSTDNEYLAVWEEEVEDDGTAFNDKENEIFVRLLAGDGTPQGTPVQVSSVAGSGARDGTNPSVAYNSTDNEYLVVWQEDGAGLDNEFEIHGQRLDADGNEIGTDNFRISNQGPDGNTGFDGYDPAVAYNATANQYLVVWSGDVAAGEDEIHGEILNADGTITVADFQISSAGSGSTRDAFSPAVAWNSTDNQYLVAWHEDADNSDNEFEVHGQLLDASGTEIGTDDFRISNAGDDGDAQLDGRTPKVVHNSANNEYFVVWEHDISAGEDEIFGEILNASGAVVKSDFRISVTGPEENEVHDALNPDVAYDSDLNQYLVVWRSDHDEGGQTVDEFEVYVTVLNANGDVFSPQERITDIGDVGGPKGSTVVFPQAVYNTVDKQFLVTFDGQETFGDYEVHAQGYVRTPVTAVTDDGLALPERFSLAQNYPNPFNPSTIIAFSLPEPAEVTLTIYNMNGQLVRTLVSSSKSAGDHTVVWDGRDPGGTKAASGLYLYQLRAREFLATRKLLLMK